MADIAMCMDMQCPMKFSCYRHTAPWNPFRQTILSESPRKGDECDEFWENKGRSLEVKFKEYEKEEEKTNGSDSR